ncbi:MAG: glycosyltransferase family 4 protein [Thermoleophilia bacterium]|nr:glycosyltransferase family 4 protein [Thermoleophilia bacterium]
MVRRLVFVTQTIDADDPNLAQTIDLVAALARRTEEVVVLADRVRRHDLPANVAFSTFGARTRVGRVLRYERALLAAGRPDALLAHMSPTFLLAAAPLLKPMRVPLALWYTHWRAGRALRLADRLCDVALTVDRASYPLPSAKVRAIGHAVDLAAFPPRSEEPPGPFRVLALGKTEPWKGFAVLLDALERVDARLEIRGPQLHEGQVRHRAELETRVASSTALRDRVTIADAVPRARVPELIRSAHAVVSPGGVRAGGEALDKVTFEAAACAVPVVASHPSLQAVLALAPIRLSFSPGDAGDLAEVLAGLGAASPEQRTEAGRMLRRWVEEEHSLELWADRVLGALVR